MAATYYSPLTIQTGQVPSTQTNFPIPYFQTAGRFATIANGGRSTSTSLYDVRPNTSTALAYDMTFELVPGTANATTGFFEMWILGASVADGGIVYMSNGDSSLTTDGSSTSTWPSQYKQVYHWANGSSLSLADSTSNANNGTNHSTTATTGKIDGGVAFVSGHYINTSTPGVTSAVSVSVWVNTTSGATNQEIINFQNDNLTMRTHVISGPSIIASLSGTGHNVHSPNALADNTSTHIVGTVDATNGIYRIYMNGVEQDNATFTGGTIDSGSTCNIGVHNDGSSNPYTGWMDELRIANSLLTANWITTEYNSESNNGAFWVLGTEVPVSGTSKVPRFDYHYRQQRAA